MAHTECSCRPAQLLAEYLHQHVAVQSLVEQQPHSSKHGDQLRQQTQQPNTACVARIHTRTCRVGKAQSDTRVACGPLHACRLLRRGIAARSAALLLLTQRHRAVCSWWRHMHSSRSALAGTACRKHRRDVKQQLHQLLQSQEAQSKICSVVKCCMRHVAMRL
jgi:hypothetical protein